MKTCSSRVAFAMIDLLVVMFLIVMIAAVAVSSAQRAQEIQRRVKCASNLRQIGQAMLLYANENRGAYPRVAYDTQNPHPTWGTPYEKNKDLGPAKEPVTPFPKKDHPNQAHKPDLNDVTAAMYLLLRTQDITSEVFICPSTGQKKWDFGGGHSHALHWTNWNGVAGLRDHLSYSYQNPYPTGAAVAAGWKFNSTLSAEYVMAGDMNPGGEALLKLTPKSPLRQMREGNSANHQRDGQNLLYGDGHVEFNNNPFVGVQRDNVYTYGKSGNDAASGGEGIVGPPAGAEDSVLLPTALEIGLIDEKGELTIKAPPPPKPPTPEQLKSLQAKLVGQYHREEQGRRIRLEVTEQQMIGRYGPISATFDYKIEGVSGQQAQVVLTAEETEPESITVDITQQGSLKIDGSEFFNGEWEPAK